MASLRQSQGFANRFVFVKCCKVLTTNKKHDSRSILSCLPGTNTGVNASFCFFRVNYVPGMYYRGIIVAILKLTRDDKQLKSACLG